MGNKWPNSAKNAASSVSVPDPRERDAAYTAYRALYALQHRGQESAGIAVRRGGQLLLRSARPGARGLR